MSKPISFTLPHIALACTAEEAKEKHLSEVEEWKAAPDGSWFKLVEAWDTLQSAYTWLNRAYDEDGLRSTNITNAVKAVEDAKARLAGQPAKVRRSKVVMLIKNAARCYYCDGDNNRILSGYGMEAR